jgi:hypothetical protein
MAIDLRSATNSLARLERLNPDQVEPNRLRDGLQEACDALGDIVHSLEPEGRIDRALQFLRIRRSVSILEYNHILRDARSFAELFVRPEAIALLRAGFSLETNLEAPLFGRGGKVRPAAGRRILC